jgi:hypothetical protein
MSVHICVVRLGVISLSFCLLSKGRQVYGLTQPVVITDSRVRIGQSRHSKIEVEQQRFNGFEMESRELLQLCPEREGSMVACRVACLATIEKAPWEVVHQREGCDLPHNFSPVVSLAPAFNPSALSRTNFVVVVSHKGNWVSNKR